MASPHSTAATAAGSKRARSPASAERCVQQRLHLAGHNSIAANDASAADGPPPVPVARLYRHALESMFAFLSKRELAFALRVSRGWLSAVGSMRRLDLQIATSVVVAGRGGSVDNEPPRDRAGLR